MSWQTVHLLQCSKGHMSFNIALEVFHEGAVVSFGNFNFILVPDKQTLYSRYHIAG